MWRFAMNPNTGTSSVSRSSRLRSCGTTSNAFGQGPTTIVPSEWTIGELDRRLCVKLGEPRFGSRQCRFFFAESEANLICAVASVIVKAGAGNRSDADFFNQIFSEGHILRG